MFVRNVNMQQNMDEQTNHVAYHDWIKDIDPKNLSFALSRISA
jgi:hypothetical protein